VCYHWCLPLLVEEYVRENGAVPYQDWFDSLDATAAAKVAVAKVPLSLGNTSSAKWFSGIGEYRIDWGPGYRVYLAKPRGAHPRRVRNGRNPWH